MKEEDLYQTLININKVAKVTKGIGLFALIPVSTEINLLVTKYFIIRMSDDQFWKVQCKLEAKEVNVWLNKTSEGLERATNCEDVEKVKAMYFEILNNIQYAEQLKSTNLMHLAGANLFADETKYFGIATKFLEMFTAGVPKVQKIAGRSNLLLDEVHLIAPVDLKNESYDCKYLKEASLC